jgi:hypothetical protein
MGPELLFFGAEQLFDGFWMGKANRGLSVDFFEYRSAAAGQCDDQIL